MTMIWLRLSLAKEICGHTGIPVDDYEEVEVNEPETLHEKLADEEDEEARTDDSEEVVKPVDNPHGSVLSA